MRLGARGLGKPAARTLVLLTGPLHARHVHSVLDPPALDAEVELLREFHRRMESVRPPNWPFGLFASLADPRPAPPLARPQLRVASSSAPELLWSRERCQGPRATPQPGAPPASVKLPRHRPPQGRKAGAGWGRCGPAPPPPTSLAAGAASAAESPLLTDRPRAVAHTVAAWQPRSALAPHCRLRELPAPAAPECATCAAGPTSATLRARFPAPAPCNHGPRTARLPHG